MSEKNDLLQRTKRLVRSIDDLLGAGHWNGNPNKPLYREYRQEFLVCPVCQKRVRVKHGNQRYCSQACRQRAYHMRKGESHQRHEVRCAVCGTRFFAKHPSRKTCSDECKRYHNRRRRRVQEGYKPRLYPKTCAECGKGYIAHALHGKYCSKACNNRHYRRGRRERDDTK